MDMIRNHKHYARHIFMGLVYKTRHFTDSGILLKYYGKKGEMYMGDIKDVLETSLDKGTQRKTTENELPSLTQCTA